MSLASSMNTAVAGMATQSKRLTAVADNIAGGEAEASTAKRPRGGKSSDLAPAMAEIVDAKTLYKANAAVLEAGADLWDVLRIIRRD